MSLARDIGKDAIRALAVLALVFLSFAHQPVAVAQPGDGATWSVADLSYCGSAPGDEGAGHAPCHACRAGIGDFPAPPCATEPAFVPLADTGFALGDDLVSGQRGVSAANPRAPPALV